MRIKQTSLELISLVVLSALVVALFRNLDRGPASMIASSLFITWPAVLMFFRWKFPHELKISQVLWWTSVGVFWLGFALPIFFMRVLHGHENFNELVLLGYPMSAWHRGSTSAFTMMALGILASGLIRYKNKNDT